MEKFYYHNNGFYTEDVHGTSIPKAAVEITEAYYKELLQGQSENKQIVPDVNGYPVLVDIEVSADNTTYVERLWRNSELNRADIELNKVQDSDPNAIGAVGDWRTYRKALRALPEHPDFPSQTARPIAPDYGVV